MTLSGSAKMPLRMQKYINKNKAYGTFVPTEQDQTPYNFLKHDTRIQNDNMLIYGVYFICCIGKYKTIVAEQLASVRKNGLFQRTHTIFCFICQYNPEVMTVLKPYMSKLKIISTTENLYEKYALSNFRQYITKSLPYYLYYFHTKAVSRDAEEFHERRRNLNYFILEQYDVCLFWLNQYYDAVGTALSMFPSLHFSGNFWWTRSSHLDRLPREINDSYLAPEMYICSHPKGKYISVCQGTNDYKLMELSPQSREQILRQSTSVPIRNITCKNLHF